MKSKGKGWLLVGTIGIGLALGSVRANAGDLRINIPRGSKLTPVQKLNREGVEAVRKHDFKKAERLFYKAYLLDPDDPFTLNNLGYVSEIQGQLDRAEHYYSAAADEPSDARIDLASSRKVVGKSLRDTLEVAGQPLEVNHANVEAVRLLSQGRAPEADILLTNVLKTDPNNVFTMNNLAVAKEMEGEDEEALKLYDSVAAAHSDASAVVTVNRAFRGRPVSQIAEQSAKSLRARLAHANELQVQVAELNLRGVSAVNRNELRTADEDFRKAYALDPNNAFTLNNIAYVAEIEGDRETADFFYERARQAGGANITVGVATRQTEEGKKLFAVARDNNSMVEQKLAQERDALRRENEPVALRRRDNSIVDESIQPEAPATPSIQPAEPTNGQSPQQQPQ